MNCHLFNTRCIPRSYRTITIFTLLVLAILQLSILFKRNRDEQLRVQSAAFANQVKKEKLIQKQAKLPKLIDEEEGYKPGVTKIDWHDWERIAIESQRKGLGEQGVPVVLGDGEAEEGKSSYSSNGFAGFVSDKISLDRAIKDIRHPLCKAKEYLVDLPRTSIIIPYYNEHWSTLMRTVHSVVNRSPPELIQEIILVDDKSSKEHCKSPVDDYLKSTFPAVETHVIHLEQRSGLIGARLAGAKAAKAEVLVFLDSHTEANVNWLPPLLEPIAKNKTTAVCPFIDVIAHDTFEYRAQDEGARGAFDWELYYKRLPLLPSDLEHPTEPFNNPVMAGGLFAINAEFFWKLGGYDEGLQIWGGEQYELSFKIWQCGGKLVDAPCSRVGHVYRKFAPFSFGGSLGKNYKRVAMVWMDEYAEYIYKRRPSYRAIDPGDISQQIALRESLQCKPFKWFMQEIAFDLPKKYPPIEPPNFAEGFIKSVADPTFCVDASGAHVHKRLQASSCRGVQSQKFKLSWHKDIRYTDSLCFDVSVGGDRAPVNFYQCHGSQGNQLWKYEKDSQTLKHVSSRRCLDIDNAELFVSSCSPTLQSQKWTIQTIDEDALQKWNEV